MPNKEQRINRQNWRRWREKNKQKDNDRIYKRKEEIRKWFVKYRKTLHCSMCPENHPACLDFHHKNKNKDFDVSLMANQGYSKKRILKEIEKCDILCSNCHRKIHWR